MIYVIIIESVKKDYGENIENWIIIDNDRRVINLENVSKRNGKE